MTVQTTVAAIRPASIHVIGPAYPAWAEAAVHIRDGYIFHPDRQVQLFENGNASFYLILGNPGQIAVDMAKASMDQAVLIQQGEYEAAVKREAAILVERQRREELEKQVADAVAASERAIAKLRKEADAELAKLSQ